MSYACGVPGRSQTEEAHSSSESLQRRSVGSWTELGSESAAFEEAAAPARLFSLPSKQEDAELQVRWRASLSCGVTRRGTSCSVFKVGDKL